VLYGIESWAATKVNENKLQIFQRKILWKIYGPSYTTRVWRIKYDGLHKLFKETNIVQSKSKQTEVVRMYEKDR
jgi:uncharacterized protein (DUF1015 family)